MPTLDDLLTAETAAKATVGTDDQAVTADQAKLTADEATDTTAHTAAAAATTSVAAGIKALGVQLADGSFVAAKSGPSGVTLLVTKDGTTYTQTAVPLTSGTVPG